MTESFLYDGSKLVKLMLNGIPYGELHMEQDKAILEDEGQMQVCAYVKIDDEWKKLAVVSNGAFNTWNSFCKLILSLGNPDISRVTLEKGIVRESDTYHVFNDEVEKCKQYFRKVSKKGGKPRRW